MRTRFRPDGGDIVIDGAKTFITSGDVADVYVLFGKWAEIEDGRAAITALVVEKEAAGHPCVRLEDKAGAAREFHRRARLRGRARAAREPDPRAGRGAQGAVRRAQQVAALHRRPCARHCARRLRRRTAYIGARRQSGRRFADFQGIQFMLADLATELAQAELWLGYVAGLVDEGLDDIGIEASMAKLTASDLAMKAADMGVQLHGGSGYIKDYRAERLLRDAKITQIWEGTNQIHRQLIGRSFARRP